MARVGMERMRYAGAGDKLTGWAGAGFGASLQMLQGMQGYLLLGGELLSSDQFDSYLDFGLGPVAGIRGGTGNWNYLCQVEWSYSFMHQHDWLWSITLGQALHIAPDISLRLGFTSEQEFDDSSTETVLSLLWYF